ncbi:MAG: PAS domain S-box protein [Candidatus Korobacteraceae bacterium]
MSLHPPPPPTGLESERLGLSNEPLPLNSSETSERHYRLLFENLLDGFAYCKMLYDQSGRPEDFLYLEVNQAFESLTGLHNIVGKKATEAIPEIARSHPELLEIYGRVASTGQSERFEIHFRPLGKWLTISVYSPAKDFFVAVFDDISTRKQSERELRELAAIVEATPDAIIGTRPDGTITSWNSAAERLYLFPAKEAVGKLITMLAPPGQEEMALDVLERARRGAVIYNCESRLRRKDEVVIDVSLTAAPIRDEAGQVVGVSTIAHDIGDIKRAGEQLRLQASALTATANAIAITNNAGQILWINPAFTTLTGYQASEVIGKNPRVLKSGHHPPEFYEQMWRTILDGRVWRGEVSNLRKDRSCYTEEMTITPVFSTAGAIQNFIAIKQDVTSRNSLEKQLRQSQKLEAIGRLAGGVAHDFNNMLMVITSYAELLQERVEHDEQLSQSIEGILNAANRAASLTHQLLAFSRKQILMPKVLDLNEILAEVGKLLPRIIGEDIELKTIPGPALGLIKADVSQLHQVIMNLAVNARDAMPDGGRLTIETRNTELDECHAREEGMEGDQGAFVMLTVSDTGIGMDKDTQAHIFEPFFTTKEVEKGTGLGLSIVYGVVTQSNGFIRVYSEPGQGTSFKIYLPKVEDPAASVSSTKLVQRRLYGCETILLVEDEDGVREAIRDFLQTRGYIVLDSDNPLHAIALAHEYRNRIHLLITDMIMPQMNGLELASRIQASRENIGVLYISGYTDRGFGGGGVIGTDANFLQKPFALDELGRRVRDILEP